MRILIHDFAGHPFQMQLSRQLAARGHFVTHVSRGQALLWLQKGGYPRQTPILLASAFMAFSYPRSSRNIRRTGDS